MKAYELHPAEDFTALQQIERPDPSSLGDHEVCVRVHAVSLNYRDLVIAKMSKGRTKRIVPASDGAGEVLAVGPKVTRVKVGDRVAAAFFPTWLQGGLQEIHHSNALGGSLDGMMAEQVVLPETAWVKLPAGYSFEEGATLPCAGVTAWNALYEAGSLKSGETILVQGTGGVSIFALQLARAAGARVIATSSSAEKRERLVELGVESPIDYRQDTNWGNTAREATGGRGVDLVVEVGGAGTFDQSIKALRFGGTMSLIGVLTGTQGPIDTRSIFHKNIRVHGVYVGSVTMFEDFVRALEAAKIQPILDQVFPFDQAREAYEYMAASKHFGKVVIRID